MGGLITAKAMQAKPAVVDQWLIEGGKRGAGRLMARITPNGERLFYFRYTRTDGTRDTLLIGSYSEKQSLDTFSVQSARARALEWSALIQPSSANLQPITNRDVRAYLIATQTALEASRTQEIANQLAAARALKIATLENNRRAVTLKQIFQQWQETALTPRLKADGKRLGRKDGGKYVAEQFSRHVFPSLGDVPIANIRKPDVFAILDRLKTAQKMRTANVILADLKQLFRFAAEREIIDVSPIERIKKESVGGSDTERERNLDDEEISALSALVKTANLAKRTQLGVWLILATGVRAGELTGAVWGNHKTPPQELHAIAKSCEVKFGIVNLATRQWQIFDTKNQRDHTVHLSVFAVEKFKELAGLREHHDWIFPDGTGKKPVCVKSFGKQIADRQRSSGEAMKNRSKATSALVLRGGRWTAHDLRRTAATLMAKLGISNDVINECLNHKQADRMTRVYVKDRRHAEQAIAFDKLGRRLHELCSATSDSNPTAFHVQSTTTAA